MASDSNSAEKKVSEIAPESTGPNQAYRANKSSFLPRKWAICLRPDCSSNPRSASWKSARKRPPSSALPHRFVSRCAMALAFRLRYAIRRPAFGDLYCNLVSAGEFSGALPQILRRQSQYLIAMDELPIAGRAGVDLSGVYFRRGHSVVVCLYDCAGAAAYGAFQKNGPRFADHDQAAHRRKRLFSCTTGGRCCSCSSRAFTRFSESIQKSAR